MNNKVIRLNIDNEEYRNTQIPEMHRSSDLCFKINQYSNYDHKRRQYLEELFDNKLPVSSNLFAPLEIDAGKQVKISE